MTDNQALLRGLGLASALAAMAWLLPLRKLSYALFAYGFSPSNATLLAQALFLSVVVLGTGIVFRKSMAAWLGLTHARGTAKALLIAIPSHVLTTWVALAVALPSLTRDLAQHGSGVARTHAAPLVRATTEAPWFVTIVSSALVAALFEEVVFRGLLWSVVARAATWFRNLTLGPKVLSNLVPLVACSLIFAALHADTPGGVGLVRVVSAATLGLVCGFARASTGSVVPAIVIHAINNLIAIGRARAWVGTDPASLVFGVPPVLIVLAVISLFVLATIFWRTRMRPSSVQVDERGSHP